ncbi:Protein tyrosine phosphatase type IVA 1 [Phlyctochytrium planicorne]|nr:Protein tyrosine phosphatase type IVA 1 [Phlyctochytrium planicorne]
MPSRSIPFSRVMTSIDYKSMKFVVFDCPTETTLALYVEELKSRNVTDVVRVCEPTYDKGVMESNGIRVHDMAFPDGSIPPTNVIMGFLHICDERFAGGISGVHSAPDAAEGSPSIGVHCVAGLGRAPVLVAMSLIEANMSPLDAVEFVRRRRRGAFNSVQLTYLIDSYKRVWKKSGKFGGLLSSNSSSSNSSGSNGAGSKLRPVSPLGKKASSVGTNGSTLGESSEENGSTPTPPALRTKSSFLKVFGGFRKGN